LVLRDPELKLRYNASVSPFIKPNDSGDAILVRQDGRQKHGRPVQLSLKEASRTALSTSTTSEFPHLYALRETLTSIRFLEINPRAARNPSDRFEDRVLKPDASNLAAVLAHLKGETATELRPDGVLSDIAADLASLIPILLELDRCLSLVASALGRGGLPKSSPPYDSRFVARVDVNEGWYYSLRSATQNSERHEWSAVFLQLGV
jgi:hypothetical protein